MTDPTPTRNLHELSEPTADGCCRWRAAILNAIAETEAAFACRFAHLTENGRRSFLANLRWRLAERRHRAVACEAAREKREERWRAIQRGERAPMAITSVLFAEEYVRPERAFA